MSTETTRATIDAYYAALRTGKADAVRALLTDDCVWVPPSTAPFGTVEGADAVTDALAGGVVRTMFDISKPFGLEVRRVLCDGDMAVVQQRITATAKATGLAYDNQYCWVYTVRDGKVAHMEEYADTLLASRVFAW